jgi:hypothetical protein
MTYGHKKQQQLILVDSENTEIAQVLDGELTWQCTSI